MAVTVGTPMPASTEIGPAPSGFLLEIGDGAQKRRWPAYLAQIAALKVASPRERFTEWLPVPRLQELAEVVNNIVNRTELSLSTGPITAEMQACVDAVCQDLLRVGAGYRGALGRRAFDA